MLIIVLSYYPKDTGELSTEYLDVLNYSNKRDYEGSFQLWMDTFALKVIALQKYYSDDQISTENVFANRENYENLFDDYFESITTVFELLGNRQVDENESLSQQLFSQ
jgi:hypothetical protein